jgi:hypothetical protein
MTVLLPHQPGDRVRHPLLGTGTVREVGERYVAVVFDEDGESLLKIGDDELEPEDGYPGAVPEPDNGPDEIPRESRPWPESTFVPEERGQDAHAMGSHWEAFGGAAAWVERLPEIVKTPLIQAGFGSHGRQPLSRRAPADWPVGYIQTWPLRVLGAATVHRIDKAEKTISLVSMYPFFSEGSQHTVELKEVLVWDNGCEAQLTVRLGEAKIVFYDTCYLTNRAWYKAGDAYDFILTGIAYEACPARTEPFKVQQDPEVAAWHARMEREQGRESVPEREMTIRMEGMAFLLPADEADDYSFRGPILSVRDIGEILGQRAWLLEVTVLRCPEDVPIKILITRSAWKGDSAPRVGEDVEGFLWLQGYLWLAHSWRDPQGHPGPEHETTMS